MLRRLLRNLRAILLGTLAAVLLLPALADADQTSSAMTVRNDAVTIRCAADEVLGADANGVPVCRASGHRIVAEDIGLHCDGSANDTATLRSALEAGGRAAGKTLWLASGCKVLLGSTGADPIDLAPSTSVVCEDQTAGFALARRRCTGGALDKVACDADAQCQGGTCSLYDADAGGSFAPDAGTTYTLFRAGSSTGPGGQRIIGCSIWVNQAQGDSTSLGGNGIETGYCVGGANDGKTCFQTCDAASATFAGVSCNAPGAADCGGASGSCQNRSQCAEGGGTCTSIPYDVSRGASGAGGINPIDFGNALYASVVRDVVIWDHRKGDFSIASGRDASSFVEGCDTTRQTVAVSSTPALGITSYNSDRFVTYGIKSRAGARILNNVAHGWDGGIYVGNNTFVRGNRAESLPGAITNSIVATSNPEVGLQYASWKGAPGFLVEGVTAQIESNVSSAFICAAGANGGQTNWLFRDNVCENNQGVKLILAGAGNFVTGNRLAWLAREAVIALGDPRGRCAGGPREGLLCLRNLGTDATYGCPSSTCAFHADFKWNAVGHATIDGNLIHTSTQGSRWIEVAPTGRRCMSGADAGKECTSTADCAASASCEYPYIQDLSITGNNFYGGAAKDTAIDFSAIAGARSAGVTTPLLNINIDGNRIQGFGTGVKFANAPGLASNVQIAGSFGQNVAPLVNWDWSYGDVAGMRGLAKGDDQGVVIDLDAGETLTRGQLVSVSASADGSVTTTSTANPERVIGVALNSAARGATAKVMTSGNGVCIADGSITRGDRLQPSGSVAGSVASAPGSAGLCVGSALETTTSGSTFRCIVGCAAIQTSAASPR